MDPIGNHLPKAGVMPNSDAGSKQRRACVARLVATMLDCFRPSQGVDPQVFATAIIGILLEYPDEIILEVTDPLRGLPAKQQFMPSPFDVKQACELHMRPRRANEHNRQAIARQLAERDAIEDQRAKLERKQTISEIEDEMAARGLVMPGYARRQRAAVDRSADLPDWLKS